MRDLAMDFCEPAYGSVSARVRAAADAAATGGVRLLAVSKGQPSAAIRRLAGLGQHAFGENYVQEALAKQDELSDRGLEWHLIGPLQSNKCRVVARRFDWRRRLARLEQGDAAARRG